MVQVYEMRLIPVRSRQLPFRCWENIVAAKKKKKKKSCRTNTVSMHWLWKNDLSQKKYK